MKLPFHEKSRPRPREVHFAVILSTSVSSVTNSTFAQLNHTPSR